MKVEYLGNQELLQLKKAAFLASSTISSETVLQVYDWATEMRNRGECVVSGFSNKLEQDVLHFLLKGSQPIIIVLARKMYKVIPDELSIEHYLIIYFMVIEHRHYYDYFIINCKVTPYLLNKRLWYTYSDIYKISRRIADILLFLQTIKAMI